MVAGGPFAIQLSKVDKQLQYDKFRIIQSLTHLSTFEPPTVAEWLINLRALVNHQLVLLLESPVPTLDGYAEQLTVTPDDMTIDSCRQKVEERYAAHMAEYDDIMSIVASIIIARVRWQNEPALRALVQSGSASDNATSQNGHALYEVLVELADSSRDEVQNEYIREWAEIMVCAEQGQASGVFADATTYQRLLAAHDQQMRN